MGNDRRSLAPLGLRHWTYVRGLRFWGKTITPAVRGFLDLIATMEMPFAHVNV
ncbi:hypothetical protein M2175_001300 [Bradyrhizobium elkanii]|nr:hypothetical protein [Bradyrhizobium elkanii]